MHTYNKADNLSQTTTLWIEEINRVVWFLSFSAADLNQEEDQQNGWDRFVSSVTARYNVAQLVEKVRAMAEFTFDFISLLIVAS